MISGNVNFTNTKNYLKRDISSNSSTMAAPVTAYGGGYRTTLVIPHSLGKFALFRLYYQPFKNGAIYPATGTRVEGGIIVNGLNSTGPYCFGTITASALTIELGYKFNSLTGQYPVYWVIYRDYGLV